MNKLTEHWFSYAIILIWVIVCIVCQKIDLVSCFSNKGLDIIDGEYYRFATALFLHSNFLHVLANSAALFFVGKYLEPQINPTKLLVFSILIGIITEAIFSLIYRNAVSIGGSPVVFALIGLIVSLQFMKTDITRFQLGTWYGNWILGYAILANIPALSTSFASTLTIHGVPLCLGILFGCVGIWLHVL